MDIEKDKYVIAMQRIVDTAMGVPKYSYPMYQNSARPPVAKFAAIRILGVRSVGYADIKKVVRGDKLFQRTENILEVNIDVLFNRGNSAGDVMQFDNCFYRPDVQAKCTEVGMEFLRKQPTKLRNRALETNWEIRTGLTCIMAVQIVDEYEIDYYTGVRIVAKFNNTDIKIKI